MKSLGNRYIQNTRILKFISIALTINIFVVLLSSCSKEPITEMNFNKSYNSYTVTLTPIQDYSSFVQDVLLSDEGLCVVTESFSKVDADSFCSLSTFGSNGEFVNSFELPENINSDCFESIVDGKLGLATHNNSIVFVDLATGEINKEVQFDNAVYGIAACEEGYVVFNDRVISKYSDDDSFISSINCSDLYYYYGLHPYFEKNGKSYVVGYNKNFSPTYYELDFDLGVCNEVLALENVRDLWCESYGQYLFDDNFEYEIDLDNLNLVQLYSLNYTDIKPERYNLMQDYKFVFDQEHFADVYAYTNDIIDVNFYYYDESIDMSSRELITIGGYDVNTDLAIRTAVYQFNTSQNEYRAVIEDYTRMFGWTDAVGAQARQAELITYFNNGNAPDIYYGNSFDYDYMGRNDMVIDLSSYIDESGILTEATDSIRNSYGETIYSMFPAYRISGYFSLKDEFPDNDLSLDELIAYSEEHNMVPIDRHTSVNIADILLRYSLRQNFNSGSEHVYTIDELEQVINTAIDYGVSTSSPNIRVNGLFEVVGRIYPIAFDTVSCVEDVYLMQEQDNGRFSFVGYPNVHGSTHVIEPIGRIAISSSSSNIEQCMNLISMLFTDETQTILSLNRTIPINQRILEESVNTYPYATPEIIEDYMDMINEIDTVMELDWGVYNIIAEEVESYYLSNKTPEEIAVTLQNRLDLYVSENY